MQAIDAMWARDFPNEKDWREISDEWGLPGYLADIASDANLARDEHLGEVIVHLVRQGERVFVITGSSHAVKLDGPLRSVLESDR
jgi:hypothetical protein